MVRRIWHEGYVRVDERRPLEAVRKAVLASAENYNCEVVSAPDVDRAEPRCLDLEFRWTDNGVSFAGMLALRMSEAAADCVEWFLAAACVRAWSPAVAPPSMLLGLDDLQACDRAGFELEPSRIMNCEMLQPARIKEFVELVAGWIKDPDRTSGFLVLGQSKPPIYLGSAGLMLGIAVDEIGRTALNEALPTRLIPYRHGRLFMPTCDGLPDVTAPVVDRKVVREMRTGLHQLLHARQSTPFPTRWQNDQSLLAWWNADPFTAQQPDTTAATDAVDVHIEQRLREALQQIDILRRQKRIVEAELAETRSQNSVLGQRLAEQDIGTEAAALAAQLIASQADADRHAAAQEEAEAERDALRRQNGLLIVQLAQAGATPALDDPQNTREFANFAELLNAASELPGIVVTADSSPATALDHHPKAPMWRRKAWDAMLTLHAYVVACTTGPAPHATHADVRTFARTGQPGSLISASIIKSTESDSVMRVDHCRMARVFPVRTVTDPTGRAFFGAHIALERWKNPAPRIHFLDDVTRNGLLYVGYIGEHLPNTKTN